MVLDVKDIHHILIHVVVEVALFSLDPSGTVGPHGAHVEVIA